MKYHVSLWIIALAHCPFASSALGQSVTETRVFNGEIFRSAGDGNSVYFPNFDLSLPGPVRYLQGDVVSVDLDLVIDWTVDLQVTNHSNSTSEFIWDNGMGLMPKRGDCASYRILTLAGSAGVLSPGDIGSLLIQQSWTISENVTNFFSACGGVSWTWDDLWLWNQSLNGAPLTYLGDVPSDWVRGVTQAVVTGTFTVEWSPTPLPSSVICDGNSPSSTIVAAGGFEDLWLLQANPHNTLGLLLQSSTATSTVPASGLCVGAGGASVTRLPGSASQGGAPYQLTYDPLFAGTTQYFQAWFRAPSGGTGTGQCIGVLFP